LLSCSKKDDAPTINNIFLDKESSVLKDIQDNNLPDNQGILPNENLTIDDTIMSNKRLLQDFFDHPFIDKNIIVPNFIGYNSFDELFNHLGTPINEFPVRARYGDDEGNYDQEFEYPYYNIGTLYVKSKDVIYITWIWINMVDEILYNHNIKKNDKPDKIIELFGTAFYIFNNQKNKAEYNYFLPDNWRQINFQFVDEELTAIVYHIMN
jgi:hypothetical protein